MASEIADSIAPAHPPEVTGGPASPSPASSNGVRPSGELSASAKAFVPGEASVTSPSTGMPTAEELLARLPPGHRMMLRHYFQDKWTGQTHPYYVGVLKTFSNRTGYGFIECKQAFEDWGTDVFVHKNNVPNPWNLGQLVEFAVTLNTRGQPQAADVSWLPKVPERRAPPLAAAKPAVGYVAQPRPDPPMPQPPPAPAASSTGAAADGAQTAAAPPSAPAAPPAQPSMPEVRELRYLGGLKSFSSSQGYGFISCEAIFQKHQRDVYFDKSQLPASGYRHGQTVEFAMVHNAKGNPQARDIVWEPVPALPLNPSEAAAANAANAGAATLLGSAAAGNASAAAGQKHQRGYTSKTVEKLQKLLKTLHEKGAEDALVSAIDFQGQGNNAGQAGEDAAERDVDYVTFVLDRLGDPAVAVVDLKDFVKMLLLLMLAKMMRRPFPAPRGRQQAEWFEALADKIEPWNGGLQSHYSDVVTQIKNHISAAERELSAFFVDKQTGADGERALLPTIQNAVKRLEAKNQWADQGGTAK